MRAVVLDADGRPELVDVPVPDGPAELVRVRACGLCGSDVEKLGTAAAGAVLGHEVEGELGDGRRVTVVHRVPCGACDRCRAGHESTCAEFAVARISPGGFAEQLRAEHVVPLPDTLPAGDGIWVEPVACILRAERLLPPGRVLVVGCGAVGQLWVQVLGLRGRDVAVLEPLPERAAQARALGASDRDGPVDAAVLTAVGGLDDALARLEPGGTLLVFAAPPGLVSATLETVYRKELVLVGSRSATPARFAEALELLPSLVLPPQARLPLSRFAEGVELYRRGEALKVVFTP